MRKTKARKPEIDYSGDYSLEYLQGYTAGIKWALSVLRMGVK